MTSAASHRSFVHWMLREIYEQPSTLACTFERYIDGDTFRESTCAPIRRWLADLHGDLVIAASGSSRHAGMVAELTIEDLAGVAVDVEYASEYCYRSEKSLKDAAVVLVSQSGETADTLAALRKAHDSGHQTLAITNVATSAMAREATLSVPILAGLERAIPATKSFTAQLLVLHLFALLAAESRSALEPRLIQRHLRAVAELPCLIAAQIPAWESSVREVADRYTGIQNFLFLGRGTHYPVAREGALKLKESAYLHAEGYPTGELKHGPNALVSSRTPLVIMATVDRTDPGSLQRYDKTLNLMADMRSQGANILAISNHDDRKVAELATHVLPVRETTETLLPICEIIPLQLFAYFMSINNGIDVDSPRNLVKAVVQE